MNELQIYNFNDSEVRTVLINNEPWFVLKDVCFILELTNPTMVAGRLDNDEVTKFNLGGLSGESNIVNESGLYKVIFQSKKPEAKKFTKWVTSEVLPSIRKTGGYGVPKTRAEALRLAADLEEQNERLQIENTKLKPKAFFADAVATSRNSCLIGELAKILKANGCDIGQNRLFQRLRDDGYLMSKGESYNLPTQKSMNLELMEIKKSTKTNPDGSTMVLRTTKITGKGQIYFVNKYCSKEN